MNYVQERFHVNLNFNLVGERVDADSVTFANFKLPGYTRVDLASSFNLPWKPQNVQQLTLYGKIENLFDKRYQEADGFRARPLNFLVGIRGLFKNEP